MLRWTASPCSAPAPTPERPQGLCLDKGYDFDEVRKTLHEFGFTAHIRGRGEEAQAIKKEAGFKAPALGGGTHSQLDEPLSTHSGPLGQVSPATTSPFFISAAPLSLSEPQGY